MDDRLPTDRFPTHASILVIDDQPSNVELLSDLLELWGYQNVTTLTSSAQAIEVCDRIDADLILLDLQMPTPNGFEVMELLGPRIREPNYLPVLVLTADVTPETRTRALSMGAKDFLDKPFDLTEIRLRVRNLLETRQLHCALRAEKQLLEKRVQARTDELRRSKLEVLERLGLAAEFRDDDTREHAQRVGRTAALLARELGHQSEAVEQIRRAALLHDIGKIGIPDAVLLKPGKLTESEYELMKTHTVVGGEILGGGDSTLLFASAEIALSHHERWDGTGYPSGLSGEQIPLSGRISALADVFDALTHTRPYKDAWPIDRALREIHELAGSHFDPTVVAAFGELDPEGLLKPIGDTARSVPVEARVVDPPSEARSVPPERRPRAASRAVARPSRAGGVRAGRGRGSRGS